MLIADPQAGQPGRDRVSFFIFPRSEVAPVVYDYAYKMVDGKTTNMMPEVLHETFSKTISEARATAPEVPARKREGRPEGALRGRDGRLSARLQRRA